MSPRAGLRRPPTLLAALALVLITACEAGPTPVPDHVRFLDGEPVPTLEIGNLWSGGWPERPGLVIDTLVAPQAGDDIDLLAPLYAAFLSDGRMVLGDAGTRQLRITSGDGSWEVGPGPGSGPGELRSLGGVWASDEGFIVHDPQAGTRIHFDAAGTWIEQHPAAGASGPWIPRLERLGDGDWLAGIPETAQPTAGSSVLGATLRLVRGTGDPDDERVIGTGPLQPYFVQGGGAAPIPFASIALFAGAAGSVVHFAGEVSEVDRIDPLGETTLRLRWTDMREPLDASHREALGDYIRQSAPTDTPPEFLDQMIAGLQEGIPYPDRLPALGALRLGSDGAIWLGGPIRSGLETDIEPELIPDWRVVIADPDTDEARVYRTALPAGTTLLGPVHHQGPAQAPGWSGSIEPGAFFVLFRDEMDRQGIGILRP
ncbi:MAG: hypothetical protein EA351_11455 [Gemmatimonadales bacterium]|nr:MAG: hypothetical protein EA351_11455 [Gemmatimonadales bacterium]